VKTLIIRAHNGGFYNTRPLVRRKRRVGSAKTRGRKCHLSMKRVQKMRFYNAKIFR